MDNLQNQTSGNELARGTVQHIDMNEINKIKTEAMIDDFINELKNDYAWTAAIKKYRAQNGLPPE